MSNHTPGPWTEHSGMVWKDGPTERDANARLLAAIHGLLDGVSDLDDDARERFPEAAVVAANAAILNTTGEPPKPQHKLRLE